MHAHTQAVCVHKDEPARLSLHNTRDWQALLVTHVGGGGGGGVLYVNVHFDPESTSTPCFEHCVEISGLIKCTSARGMEFAGDFNTQRSPNLYLARSMRPGQCLNALHLDYAAGQHTNVVWNGRHTISTEIDYIILSRHMRARRVGSRCTGTRRVHSVQHRSHV